MVADAVGELPFVAEDLCSIPETLLEVLKVIDDPESGDQAGGIRMTAK